ncbi:MAG: hypothetical protein JWQ11_1806 [Rhizobacter sp.]|nr:hypothetical protein [Rhizobacter sp.]
MIGMSATVHFSIKYDGPALANHEMDIRELAPALVALATLLEQANREAFPESPEVRVNVLGNFKGGSFGVDLTAVQSITEQLVSMFTGPEATASANLFALLAGIGLLGSGGLIGVIKWLRGRTPTDVRVDGDEVFLECQDSTTVETFQVDLITLRLLKSRTVRQTLAKVVKPLEREGIFSFSCGRKGAAKTVVTKEDAAAFEAAAKGAEIVSDTLSEGVLLQIESAVFKEAHKWRLNDGTNSFFAEINDQAFLARIDAGQERFGKGDLLIVDLRRIQSVTNDGLKTEHTLEKVHEHREPLQAGLI